MKYYDDLLAGAEPECEDLIFARENEEEVWDYTENMKKKRDEVPNIVISYLAEIGQYKLLSPDTEAQLSRVNLMGLAARDLVIDMDSIFVTKSNCDSLKNNPIYKNNFDPDFFLRMSLEDVNDMIQRGKSAAEALTMANLRLVVYCAKKFTCPNMDLMDLIQEGNFGLMKAVERFDPSRGFRFSTYATWWIKQRISKGIAEKGRAVRIPTHMIELVSKAKKVAIELFDEYGREPTDEEIAQRLGITKKRLYKVKDKAQDTCSLNMRVGDEEDGQLSDLIPDERILTPEEVIEREIMAKAVQDSIAVLNEREKQVLIYRFGIFGEDRKTLKQIADEMKVSKERIRQIEAAALYKLRKNNEKNGLNYFLY